MRGQQALSFESNQGRVHGARGDLAFESNLHLSRYRPTVGFVPKPKHREKHCLFKRAQNLGH